MKICRPFCASQSTITLEKIKGPVHKRDAMFLLFWLFQALPGCHLLEDVGLEVQHVSVCIWHFSHPITEVVVPNGHDDVSYKIFSFQQLFVRPGERARKCWWVRRFVLSTFKPGWTLSQNVSHWVDSQTVTRGKGLTWWSCLKGNPWLQLYIQSGRNWKQWACTQQHEGLKMLECSLWFRHCGLRIEHLGTEVEWRLSWSQGSLTPGTKRGNWTCFWFTGSVWRVLRFWFVLQSLRLSVTGLLGQNSLQLRHCASKISHPPIASEALHCSIVPLQGLTERDKGSCHPGFHVVRFHYGSLS